MDPLSYPKVFNTDAKERNKRGDRALVLSGQEEDYWAFTEVHKMAVTPLDSLHTTKRRRAIYAELDTY